MWWTDVNRNWTDLVAWLYKNKVDACLTTLFYCTLTCYIVAMATKRTRPYEVATIALLLALVGDWSTRGLVRGAPVTVESGDKSDGIDVELSSETTTRSSQMHMFNEYSYDDLQDVNYTRPRPWQINQGRPYCVWGYGRINRCVFTVFTAVMDIVGGPIGWPLAAGVRHSANHT